MIERIKKIVSDNMDIEGIEITRDSILLQDLGLNSLDLMGMISELEDEFDIEISDREARSFKTVGDVIDFVEKNQIMVKDK